MKIIVLAGGSGSRLWPLDHPPKQFSHFIGEHTLFQKTLLRFLKAYQPKDFVIVTRDPFLNYARNQASEINKELGERVILEKEAKNTAPALLFALKWLEERGELDDYFVVTPSDHLIAPESLFLDKIKLAEKAAVDHFHVLFGIFPTHPHTGYGYVLCDPSHDISPVQSFVEKPPLELAQNLLDSGNCLWNMGVFLFQTKTFFNDLQNHQPEMALAFEAGDFQSLGSLSIDHALLEHSQKLKIIPLHLSWSDVGSWDSVYDLFRKDDDQNVKMGEVIAINSKNCLIIGETKPIAAIDLEDLIIVDGEEGILIAKRGSSEQVRHCSERALSNTCKWDSAAPLQEN